MRESALLWGEGERRGLAAAPLRGDVIVAEQNNAYLCAWLAPRTSWRSPSSTQDWITL